MPSNKSNTNNNYYPVRQVKNAEAEAESRYLSGMGVARQRMAIVQGLQSSVAEFSKEVDGASPKDVMDILLLSQYFDTLSTVGANSLILEHDPATVANPTIKSFEYDKFPLQVLYSMGAYCRNYTSPYDGVLVLTTDTGKLPAKKNLSYKNEEPFKELSVCELDEISFEGAPDAAIYYYKVDGMPTVPDENFEGFVQVEGAEVLADHQLYCVTYWEGNLDNYFDFYFVEIEGKFYWVMWNLCNCEA